MKPKIGTTTAVAATSSAATLLHIVDDPEGQISVQQCRTVPVEISGGVGHWIFRITLRWKFAGALKQSSVAVYLHQRLRQEINDLRIKIVAHEHGVGSPNQVYVSRGMLSAKSIAPAGNTRCCRSSPKGIVDPNGAEQNDLLE
jgi:hypothetical protein